MIRQCIIAIILHTICFGCKDETIENTEFCERFVGGDVAIGIDQDIKLEESFDLINAYDLYINHIDGICYESNLPSDSIDYVINYLNAKEYINKNGFKAVKNGSVFLHYQTGLITVCCRLWDMTQPNQQDWIKTKKILSLKEKPSVKSILLTVPVGQEKKWVMTFKGRSSISYAELNCIVEINPWP